MKALGPRNPPPALWHNSPWRKTNSRITVYLLPHALWDTSGVARTSESSAVKMCPTGPSPCKFLSPGQSNFEAFVSRLFSSGRVHHLGSSFGQTGPA